MPSPSDLSHQLGLILANADGTRRREVDQLAEEVREGLQVAEVNGFVVEVRNGESGVGLRVRRL